MREKFLIGATENNEIVFAEIDVRMRNGKREFSASFDTVYPFNASEVDLVEAYDEWLCGLEEDFLYNQCVEYDCKPSELAENMADNCYDVRDSSAFDCSLYNEMLDVNGDDWCFESVGCGQHDTRNEMSEYVNKQAYDILHEVWDNYHLKEIDDDAAMKIEMVRDMLAIVDEEAWITDYIQRVMV